MLITSVFFLIIDTVHGQNQTKKEFMFKMWLFIDHENTQVRNEATYMEKDSSLFDKFCKEIKLKYDTLLAKAFEPNFVFISVSPYKNNVPYIPNAISYNSKDNLEFIGVPVNECEGYILCVNNITGISYRIKGFKGCDLLILMRDVQEQYYKSVGKKLSDDKFLSKFRVESIDFNCLYKGIKSGPENWYKYPCLKYCRDTQVSIH